MFVVSSSLKNFHNFIQKWNFKSSELLFQYSWRKKLISSSFKCTSSSILVLKFTLYLRPRFYLEKAKSNSPVTTGVPFLQYLQPLWSDVVNARKTYQAVCAHYWFWPRLKSVTRLEAAVYTLIHWKNWWTRDQHISEVLTEVITL